MTAKCQGPAPLGVGTMTANRSSDKHPHSGTETKVLCKLEAIESYIEMIKIA